MPEERLLARDDVSPVAFFRWVRCGKHTPDRSLTVVTEFLHAAPRTAAARRRIDPPAPLGTPTPAPCPTAQERTMIRAGRQKYAQTSDELAKAMGISIGTFRNKQPYTDEDFPPLISSEGARVK